jgi:hypothetical protein
MLFAALSLCSLVIIFMLIIKNMRASKKQWWMLLLPIMFLFMAIAYRFDWQANPNNDLSRFFEDFQGLKFYGFFYEMRYADEFSWLWRIIAYIFCHVENLHLFPVLVICVEFLIFFYILLEITESHRLSALDVLLCLILRLALLPLIMTIAACRNTLAYSLFAMGVYMHYKHGVKNIWMYLWMLLGVLTHTTVIIGVVVFLTFLLAKRHKWLVFLFLLIGVLLGNVLVPMLETSSSEYVQYFVNKWDVYTKNPNQFDSTKNTMIIPGLLPILMLVVCWFISRNPSPNKEGVSYLVSNMAITVGVYGVMAELFLRLCYPTAILMPLLWAEMRGTQWRNSKNAIVFWRLLIAFVFVLFTTTRGGWLYQIYWFFEV